MVLKQSFLSVWLVLGSYPVRRSEWKKMSVSSVAGRINWKFPGELWAPPLTQHPAGTFFLTLGIMSILALSNLLFVPHYSDDVNIKNFIFSFLHFDVFFYSFCFWTTCIIAGTNPPLLRFLNLTSPGLDNMHSRLY